MRPGPTVRCSLVEHLRHVSLWNEAWTTRALVLCYNACCNGNRYSPFPSLSRLEAGSGLGCVNVVGAIIQPSFLIAVSMDLTCGRNLVQTHP